MRPSRDTIILLTITPKSSKNQIIGWVDDGKGGRALKVKIAAPPEDGKANAELIRFLAKEWGLAKSALEIVSGDASRYKRLKINDKILSARMATSTKK